MQRLPEQVASSALVRSDRGHGHSVLPRGHSDVRLRMVKGFSCHAWVGLAS